ncbi:hypothetical protein HK102_006143, partial [Quaeritorhiza haematococci]
MTFLYPRSELPERVLLAMVVCREGTFSIVLYEYWHKSPFDDVRRLIPVSLGASGPTQLFAVPWIPECAFLITEQQMMVVQISDYQVNVSTVPLHILRGISLPEVFPVTAVAIPGDVDTSTANVPSHPNAYLTSQHGFLYGMQLTSTTPYVRMFGLGRRNPVAHMSVFSSHEGTDHLALFGEMCNGEIVQIQYGSRAATVLKKSILPNWAPILDFKLVDIHREGHDVMFITSGSSPCGTLREIRNGVDVHVDTSSPDFNGVNGLWNLRSKPDDELDSFLVVSFVAETRLMYLNAGELEDISEMSGFDLNDSTIYAASLNVPGYLLQVHSKAIVVARPEMMMSEAAGACVHRWIPPEETKIAVATMAHGHVLVSLSKANCIIKLRILVDDVSGIPALEEVGRLSLEHEVSCIYPIPSTPGQENDPIPDTACLIGTHKPSIALVVSNEGQLEIVHEEILDGIAAEGTNMPQSLQLLTSKNETFLLAGIRDGSLVTFRWSWTKGARKPIIGRPHVRRLGTFPLQLVPRRDADDSKGFIVALSDRPWKIDFTRVGLGITSISFDHVLHATPFAYASGVDSFMFVSEDQLFFVKLDKGKMTNMRTMLINETPRRIIYDSFTNKLLLATTYTVKGHQSTYMTSDIKVIDAASSKMLVKETLKRNEVCYALT